MSEINISFENAMEQASFTAQHYLSRAMQILDECEEMWTMRDAIELSKNMVEDYNNTVMCMKVQEIRDAINNLSENVSELRCS